MIGCDRAHPGSPAGRAGGGARLARRPDGRGDRRRRGRQRLGSRTGCPTACTRSRSPRTAASPPGATPASPAVAGELLFFLDDDARLAAPDALARVAAAVRGPRPRAAAAARAILRRRTGAARLGAAAAGRRPGPLERRHRGLGGRGGDPPRPCSSRSAAGRRSSGFAHEGVDLAWRVMDAGRRVVYAGDIAVLHPSYAHRAARLLGLLRRPQPRLPRPPPPAAAARRPLRRRLRAPHAPGLRSPRPRPRGAARLPRRAARAVRRAPPPAREHSVAHDASRPASDSVAASLSLPLTAPVTDPEPARSAPTSSPPCGTSTSRTASACRRSAPTCASCGGGASSRSSCRAPTCARSTTTPLFGQLWLILNPLLLACVYFVLVDILRGAHGRHRVLRPPDGGAVRLLLRHRRDPPGGAVGRRRRPADPQHGVPAACCCPARR